MMLSEEIPAYQAFWAHMDLSASHHLSRDGNIIPVAPELDIWINSNHKPSPTTTRKVAFTKAPLSYELLTMIKISK